MSRKMFALGTLLIAVLAAARVHATEREVTGSDRGVVVEKALSDTTSYIKVVEITLPPELEKELQVAYRLKTGVSGTFGAFSKDTISTHPSGVGLLERARGEKTVVYRLYIERAAAGATFEITVGKSLYRSSADGEISVLKAVPAPPPIPWHTFFSARETAWTAERRERMLAASVRLELPGSGGSGTIVEPPAFLAALLKEGEELVLTAGHVIPLYSEGRSIAVDVFRYEGTKPVEAIRCDGRVLKTTRNGFGDVGCIAFKPKEKLDIVRVPVAESRRWYSGKTPLLRVGCPGGSMPVYEEAYAISGERLANGGKVTVNVPSRPGHSGGGLFDPDGVLVGICSGSNGDKTTMLIGVGLLPRNAAPYTDTVFTSLFFHPFPALELAAVAEKEAREDARWTTLKLPNRHPKFGVSEKAEDGLKEARRAIEEAIDSLPESERPEVRKRFEKAFDAYQRALTPP